MKDHGAEGGSIHQTPPSPVRQIRALGSYSKQVERNFHLTNKENCCFFLVNCVYFHEACGFSLESHLLVMAAYFRLFLLPVERACSQHDLTQGEI